MDDLRRKGDDMDRVTDLSHDLQNLLSVRCYEIKLLISHQVGIQFVHFIEGPKIKIYFLYLCRIMRPMLTNTTGHLKMLDKLYQINLTCSVCLIQFKER